MNGLSLYKDTIQSLCNILRPVLSTEIMVIDGELIAVAGTGPYRRNVGTRRPRDSYVHRSIMYGESYEIEAPKETKECLRCEIKASCPYSSVISSPVKYENQIAGIFGFLGYDHNQKRIMTGRALSLSRLSDEIASFLADMFLKKTADHETFFSSEEMTRILSSVEQGLILTDKNNRIANMNEFGERLLGLKRGELLGRNLESLQAEFQSNPSGLRGEPGENRKKGRLFAHKIPIRPHCPKDGHIIVFNDRMNKDGQEGPKKTYGYLDAAPDQELVGRSKAISGLKNLVRKISKSSSTVLITGETGTGKELVARLLHYESPRKYNPFVIINCSAVPDSLFESELFGYTGGAFTGARKGGKTGRFEMADKGTLFLDEIGYLSLEGQAKILRFLESNVIEKVGETLAREIDVRVVAATNKDLESMVREKTFLEDLYYRLNIIPLHVPPLRERIEDIPLLLEYFLKRTNHRMGHNVLGFDSNAMGLLIACQWPGNVRQLRNVVEYVCNVRDEGLAGLEDLPPGFVEKKRVAEQGSGAIGRAGSLLMEEAIRLFGNSTEGKRQAAEYLGISLTTLYRRLGKHPTIPVGRGQGPRSRRRAAS